ncbi:MAG: 4-oxalocrotonate tautomerase [Duncaniella sp.]|nr:4-oxalocrotonate tautomerase [Duncaniella sp.]
MPYISIESGSLTSARKKMLRLTARASEITNIPEQFVTETIKELLDENFGIGGKSIDEIKPNFIHILKIKRIKNSGLQC